MSSIKIFYKNANLFSLLHIFYKKISLFLIFEYNTDIYLLSFLLMDFSYIQAFFEKMQITIDSLDIKYDDE